MLKKQLFDLCRQKLSQIHAFSFQIFTLEYGLEGETLKLLHVDL